MRKVFFADSFPRDPSILQVDGYKALLSPTPADLQIEPSAYGGYRVTAQQVWSSLSQVVTRSTISDRCGLGVKPGSRTARPKINGKVCT